MTPGMKPAAHYLADSGACNATALSIWAGGVSGNGEGVSVLIGEIFSLVARAWSSLQADVAWQHHGDGLGSD